MNYQTKKIRDKAGAITSLYRVVWVIMVCVLLSAIISQVLKQKNALETTIDPSCLKVSQEEIPEQEYLVQAKDTNTGKTISIGKYELELSNEEYNTYIGDNKKIRTSIFITTYSIPTRGLLQKCFPNNVTVAKFSFLGQTQMNTEETRAEKQTAAYILTQRRINILENQIDDGTLPLGYQSK